MLSREQITVLHRLDQAGATGLDLSPGDALCVAAAALIRELCEALDRQDGKWVPLEPTKEMLDAGYRQYCTADKRGYSAWQDHLAVYRAMLAAAPEKP